MRDQEPGDEEYRAGQRLRTAIINACAQNGLDSRVDSIARRIGVSARTLNNWFNGVNQPTSENMARIAGSHHTPVDVFYSALLGVPSVSEQLEEERREAWQREKDIDAKLDIIIEVLRGVSPRLMLAARRGIERGRRDDERRAGGSSPDTPPLP